MKLVPIVTVTAALLGPVSAQDVDQFNQWVCVSTPQELFNKSFDNGILRVNNINIVDVTSFDTGRSEIKVSYSASNRSDDKAALSVEFIVKGETPVALALSASPIMGGVLPRSTEQVSETTLTPASAATNDIGEICIRLTD